MKMRSTIKTISIPTSLLVATMQLEDKDAGQLVKAIARYVEMGNEPTISNSLLKAFFALFREQIDDQRAAYEQRRMINAQNAQRKVSKKRASAKKSDSQPVAFTEDAPPIAPPPPIALQQLVDIYPKVGTYTGESQAVWDLLTEAEKQSAIEYIPVYLEQTPSTSAQYYLNQYLKAKPWEGQGYNN